MTSVRQIESVKAVPSGVKSKPGSLGQDLYLRCSLLNKRGAIEALWPGSEKVTAFGRKIVVCLIVPVAMFLSACGYRFAGSGNLPAGMQVVFITILENKSAETGIENTITGDLRYEFVRYKRSGTREKSDGILSGVVESSRVETVSHRSEHTSNERRIYVALNLKLTDRKGKVVWSVSGIADSETYVVDSDNQLTDVNKRKAISALSKRLAESVYYRLTEEF